MEETNKKLELITRYFTDFNQTQIDQFAALESLYTEWNEKINVLSRKDIGSLYERHILHSLSIAAVFPLKGEVLDLGTGGGFPGIPLAIFFPDVEFHLVDSIGKKLKVVEAIVETLDLQNVTFRHARAESIKDRKFDSVVSRAVAPLKELWTWSKPLIKKKKQYGQEINTHGLICLKGGDLSKEIFESGTRPHAVEISTLFAEEYFKEKFILFIPA